MIAVSYLASSSTSPPGLDIAWVGLLGVIVGVVVVSASSFLTARMTERSHAATEARRNQVAVRRERA